MSEKNLVEVYKMEKNEIQKQTNKKEEMEHIVNILSRHLGNNENITEELEKVLEELTKQKNEIEDFNSKKWFEKLFYKGAKWEEQAVNVYKGLTMNFLLNKENTTILLKMFTVLFAHENKINLNLKKIDKIFENENLTKEEIANKLKEFNDEKKKDREDTQKSIENLLNRMQKDKKLSKDVIEVIQKFFDKTNDIKRVDDYILEIKKKLVDSEIRMSDIISIINEEISRLDNDTNDIRTVISNNESVMNKKISDIESNIVNSKEELKKEIKEGIIASETKVNDTVSIINGEISRLTNDTINIQTMISNSEAVMNKKILDIESNITNSKEELRNMIKKLEKENKLFKISVLIFIFLFIIVMYKVFFIK